jgi:c-src tyrosine kinase
MHHLHSENIIHRDLAARNILIKRESMEVKVSDFGLSRQKDHHDTNVTETQTGPLKWMAIEALRERKYSTKSDVWSYGVVMWELLCRSEPYPHLSAVHAAIAVIKDGLRLPIPDDAPPLFIKIMKGTFYRMKEFFNF